MRLFVLLAFSLAVLQGCIKDDVEVLREIEIKSPIIILHEDSTAIVTVKSLKSFASTDTIWIQMIGGDALYGDDFTTSIPLDNDFIPLVGNGKADSISLSVTAIWDDIKESTETALFKIVKYPNGFKVGLQKEIELQIIDRERTHVQFNAAEISVIERSKVTIGFNIDGPGAEGIEFKVKVTKVSADANDYVLSQEPEVDVLTFTGSDSELELSAVFDNVHELSETLVFEIIEVPEDVIIATNRSLTVSIQNYNIGDDLVGEYLFNNSGDDTSPNFDNHGTVNGPMLASDRGGSMNAYYFDGVNDYVSIPDNSATDFDSQSDFSISLWVAIDANQVDLGSTLNDILRKWSGDSQPYPFSISILNHTHPTNPGELLMVNYDGSLCGNVSVSYSGVISNENFHHIVMIKQGDKVIQYLDNVKVSEVTNNLVCQTANSTHITVGCRGQFARFFKGKIDDLRFYKTALSPSVISELYNENPITDLNN